MNSPSFSSICPYVGMKYDSTTSCAYPSTSNHCFHCQVPAIPALEHQEAYCLVKAHVNCPVYIESETKLFPKNILYASTEILPRRKPVWKFTMLAAGILLAGFALWLGYQLFSAGQLPTSFLPIPPATLTSVAPSLVPPKASVTSRPPTVTPTPVTPTPEPSLTPTTEFPLQIHALDTPIMVGKQPFLMHRVVEGEQILLLVKKHQTSIKVLEWINHTPPAPLSVGQVIVIAPGMLVIDQTLPPFEPYQVIDKEISIEGLAGKFGVDLDKLKYYNNCSEGCRFVKGDWLLIPPATNIPIPNTPTPMPPSAPPSKTHVLEVPIMVGKQPILMHRVIEGEQITLLIKQYETTIEALQDINYIQAVPLLAGQVIVIAPGLVVNVAPNSLPSFEPYQVTDKEINIEDLVLKLGVDLTTLKYYNGCTDGCWLVKGDWLLVPRAK
jgi:hypothetical protein